MPRSAEQFESQNLITPQFSREDEEVILELEQKFGPDSREVADYINLITKENAKERMGASSKIEKRGERGRLLNLVDNVIAMVDSVELVMPNKKNEKILNKEKATVKELIEDVFKSAAAYTEAVNRLRGQVTFKSEEGKTQHYQNRVEESDRRRKQAHNAMMSNINIALRYINQHFAIYGEDRLEELADKFEDRNEPFLQVQRVKFPHNVFLPDRINLHVREDLGKWGVLVTEELAEYRSRLSQRS